MEARIIIINGPAGVGKTTVSRILAGYGSNSACIHGDDFPGYIVKRDLKRVTTGLGYKNGASVANNFIHGGYDLVVYDYVFEDQTHVPKFMNALTVNCDVYFFTLWASKETIVEREAKRLDRDRLGARLLACYQAMEESLNNLGFVINTTEDAPEKIADKIWAHVLKKRGIIADGLRVGPSMGPTF
jgi:chloramphenicol 3-O-phosphotransferase